MNIIERQLQLRLNKIEKWAMENGFKLSLQLKNCSNKRGLHPDLELKLYNSPIKIAPETKFVSLLFNSNFFFTSY